MSLMNMRKSMGENSTEKVSGVVNETAREIHLEHLVDQSIPPYFIIRFLVVEEGSYRPSIAWGRVHLISCLLNQL